MNKENRIPLGIMPYWLFRELQPELTPIVRHVRAFQIKMAIMRYEKAGLPIHILWLSELNMYQNFN
jgi:hypothetical protein